MSGYPRRSVTLVELLIAIVLLAVIILGFHSIDIFSRYHFLSTDRRAKLQNDVSFCLEHISKSAGRAIGNEAFYGVNSVAYVAINALSIFIDANNNGQVESGVDYWIGYRLDTSTHRLTYCSRCPGSACGSCSVAVENLAQNITAFTPTKDFSQGAMINVSITGCWDPAATFAACDTPDNPSVSMSTSIALPSVGTN